MFFPKDGGCACGEIRYRLGADPVTLYACHCTDCQTATGSSFALSMFVPREAVTLLRGEPVLHHFELPDGRERRFLECPGCGVALWGLPRLFPELLNLEAGTLDDTSWFRPVGHIWTRSAQPWVTIPEDTLQYPMQPEDPLPMVRAWKARSDAAG